MAKLNTKLIWALVKRDLRRYFSNPTGYVFITLFIFLSAAAGFWQDRFFLNNLANLEQLNNLFPFLLLFFIPALTMAVWSDEKKQGTDELILTLPATSFEVVLGKFASTVVIYTASLLLSLSHVLVLFWLGSPDLGMMAGNYLGYWLLGAAMISIGLLASLVTANAALAFILGSVLCGVLLFVDSLFGALSPALGEVLAPLGVQGHFGDFARGVVSLSGLCYFVSLAGLMLYLNVLVVDKRHWPKKIENRPTWLHRGVRTAALVIGLISLNVIVGRAGLRLDVTGERLHSLSQETRTLIAELQDDRPVFIHAFVSPEVPEPYVQTRADLLSVLREVEASSGSRVQVLVQDTEPYSSEARDAREKFGISPREVPVLGGGRTSVSEIFLGLAFTCGADEEVIDFLDRGLSPEYEIARSMRVVAKTERKKLGVVQTEIRLFGGVDFQTMRTSAPWSVVEELRKQYEVVEVTPTGELPEGLDGILVALPSALPQAGLDELLAYVRSGIPTLLLVDPLPAVNIGLAPSEQPGGNRNPFMQNQGPQPQPKGDIQSFLAQIGVSWDSGRVIWDSYNPHPDLANLPPEVVFVGAGNKNPEAFNRDHLSTSLLQELVLIYPGSLDAAVDSTVTFSPLLKTGRVSGRFAYSQLVQRHFFGVQLNRNLPHRPDDYEYVLAAQVQGKGQDVKTAGSVESKDSGDVADTGKEEDRSQIRPVNCIVIADLDFISEQFFQIRAAGPQNLKFDNVNFFLNCIDVLLGDESFIALRNKRVRHRTLERVEAQTQEFVEKRIEDEKNAEAEAERALAEAQRRLEERVAEVQQRPDLDSQTKQIMARNLQEVENRRFEVRKANIEREKQAKIHVSQENMEEQIRRIQSNIKTFAVLFPPIPVFVLGVIIFVKRQRREKEGASAARRLRA